jgi:enamine deaminase RidA (YjgF/YER057c/UK114 family)
MSFEQNLTTLGIILPQAAIPVANYVPCVIAGTTLYVSGQLPVPVGGSMIKGIIGRDVNIDQGRAAAEACALNIFAQARAALGSLDRIKRCVKLGVFVASTPEFTDHPKIANGASDLVVSILGDAGKHARFAVGVAALPLGAAVEIDAIFEIV